ncbi:testis-expressed sequence 11 hypothetical protein [Limosa lapponica baueri]|uniref:Uncharacterized protein n=1 Tax=Limosa lapponica baueri TaxID=1758121 RepID=A0A2I0T7X6_LIMLA|nr:testis-expressed sequence 11 hypothetical protein [Limosa lapponica baueri]
MSGKGKRMSMKTGKGWIDIGKADLADGFLEIAMNSIEKLYAKLLKGSDGEADIHVHKAEVEKNLFKVLSYQAESSYDIGKMDMKYSVGKEMQAKVLRLLATAYFEWDCNLYLDKALKAISLANQVFMKTVQTE